LLADALGSTVGLVTSNNGPIATNYTYQPFGAATTGGSANGSSYQFTGRENDGTGLDYYRTRYYSPTFQRFIAQDPTDFLGGINLYGYVSNNPQSLRDPLGLWVAGVGLNGGAGGLGAGGSWTKELVFDGEGNIGIATTICAGGMTTVASGGGGGAVSFNSSLSTISELAGPSLEVGAAFPVGEGWEAGASLTAQKNKCGKPTFGGNVFFGGAGGWPPIPITLGGVACNTTVQPISWTITGPTGGDVPSLVPVP
jgi:RHS repeat-associated protein